MVYRPLALSVRYALQEIRTECFEYVGEAYSVKLYRCEEFSITDLSRNILGIIYICA